MAIKKEIIKTNCTQKSTFYLEKDNNKIGYCNKHKKTYDEGINKNLNTTYIKPIEKNNKNKKICEFTHKKVCEPSAKLCAQSVENSDIEDYNIDFKELVCKMMTENNEIKNMLLKRITEPEIRLAENDLILFALGLRDDLAGRRHDRGACE